MWAAAYRLKDGPDSNSLPHYRVALCGLNHCISAELLPLLAGVPGGTVMHQGFGMSRFRQQSNMHIAQVHRSHNVRQRQLIN